MSLFSPFLLSSRYMPFFTSRSIPKLAFSPSSTTSSPVLVGFRSSFRALYLILYTGITAGYHRLWAHRAYNASKPLQYVLAMAGAGAVEGSIRWWSRGHRAHHRYTDTDLDPYNAHQGFWYSHIGWMLLKPRRKPGVADISDLSKNEVVRWQHRWYISLLLLFGFVVPTAVPGLFWGDWKGGYFFAATARLVFVHHVCPRSHSRVHLSHPVTDSLPSVSTLSLIGSVRLRLMTSTHPAIMLSPLSSLLGRGITISTTNFPWTTVTPSNGTNTILPNGSSGLWRSLAWPTS
jgi:hypothetical protein